MKILVHLGKPKKTREKLKNKRALMPSGVVRGLPKTLLKRGGGKLYHLIDGSDSKREEGKSEASKSCELNAGSVHDHCRGWKGVKKDASRRVSHRH